jgi:hypothetical protein
MRHTEMVEWWVQATAVLTGCGRRVQACAANGRVRCPIAWRPGEFAGIAALTTGWPDGILGHTTRVLFVFSLLVSLLGSPYACQDCA